MNLLRAFIKIIISSLAILATAWLLPGVTVDNYLIALIVAIVLAFLNTFIKPLLIILTIPATIFTFGFFLLVINAFIILMAAWLVEGFHVKSFWWALLFSFILSLLTSVMEELGRNKKDDTF